MAITLTSLTAAADGTNRASYTTASVSPTANKVLCAAVLIAQASNITPGTPSISGLSLSWTTEKNNLYDNAGADGRQRVLFAYALTGASPGSGTITFDLGGTTHDGAAWAIFEITGDVDLTGSDPIVQSATGSGTGTTGSATLASFADSTNNVALGIFAHEANEGKSVGSGFTELADTSTINPSIGLQVEYKTGEDTSVDATWSTSKPWGAIAAEIRFLAPDVTVTGDSGAATASGGTATPVVTVTADSGVATAAGGDATVIGDKTVTGDSGSASADGSAATPVVAVSGDAGSASADGGAATTVVSVAATAGAATAAGTTAVPTITVTADSGVASAAGTDVTVYGAGRFKPDGLTPTVLTLTPISPSTVSVSPVAADTLTATPVD